MEELFTPHPQNRRGPGITILLIELYLETERLL
jgi:hypothetical protein